MDTTTEKQADQDQYVCVVMDRESKQRLTITDIHLILEDQTMFGGLIDIVLEPVDSKYDFRLVLKSGAAKTSSPRLLVINHNETVLVPWGDECGDLNPLRRLIL